MSKSSMTRGVIFHTMAVRHFVRLVVALNELRKHYDGPVIVYHDDRARDSVWKRLALEKTFGDIKFLQFIPQNHGQKNSHYATKPLVAKMSPFDETIFFDADTLVVGSIDELWCSNFPDDHNDMIITQFSTWVSTGNLMSSRIHSWEKYAKSEVERMLSSVFPAINTGVYSFKRDTVALQAWEEMTLRRGTVFMCDELAMQLIFPDYKITVVSDEYNASPIYIERPDEEVKIWHFHGAKHLANEKAIDLWLPCFEECVKKRICNLTREDDLLDKWTKKYLKEN